MFKVNDEVFYVCDDERIHPLTIIEKWYNPEYDLEYCRCKLETGETLVLDETMLVRK